MSHLEGKVALVTGGASGIGAATVRYLINRGASVMVADADAAGAAEMADETGAHAVVADVTSPEANESMVASVVDVFGGVDMVFLNAGVLGRPIDQQRSGEPFDPVAGLDRYELAVGVNLHGVVYGIAAAVPALRLRRGGAIVATASAAGVVPWPPDPLYTLTKHGVVGYVRAIAPSLEPDAITVNAICPGGVATPLVGSAADAPRPPQLLAAEVVAASMVDAALGTATGQAITVVHDRATIAMPHQFADIPGFP